MKAMKKMGFCAIMTASVFALSGVAMGEEKPKMENVILQNMQDSNTPAILVKAENFSEAQLAKAPFTRHLHDSPSRLVVGKIVLSSTEEYKPGTLVLMDTQAEGQVGSKGQESPYWLIDVSSANAPIILADGAAIFVSGWDFRAWSGDILIRDADKLTGVWKQMAEAVKK